MCFCVFYVRLPGQYRRQLPSASLSVSDMTMMKNEDDVKASDDDSDEDSDDDDDLARYIFELRIQSFPINTRLPKRYIDWVQWYKTGSSSIIL